MTQFGHGTTLTIRQPMPSAYDHPDWNSFIEAVRNDPDEDLHRLVAADWLQEHGEKERAELIRLMIQYWRDPNLKGLSGRITDLTGGVWQPGHPTAIQSLLIHVDGDVQAIMRRGFLEELVLPGEAWVAHADGLYHREAIRQVQLTTWPRLERIPAGFDDRRSIFWLWERRVKIEDDSDAHGPAMVERLLKAEWPKLSFELPNLGGAWV